MTDDRERLELVDVLARDLYECWHINAEHTAKTLIERGWRRQDEGVVRVEDAVAALADLMHEDADIHKAFVAKIRALSGGRDAEAVTPEDIKQAEADLPQWVKQHDSPRGNMSCNLAGCNGTCGTCTPSPEPQTGEYVDMDLESHQMTAGFTPTPSVAEEVDGSGGEYTVAHMQREAKAALEPLVSKKIPDVDTAIRRLETRDPDAFLQADNYAIRLVLADHATIKTDNVDFRETLAGEQREVLHLRAELATLRRANERMREALEQIGKVSPVLYGGGMIDICSSCGDGLDACECSAYVARSALAAHEASEEMT